MLNPLINKGNELIKRIRKLYAYLDLEYSISPVAEITKLKQELADLEKQIPEIETPKTLDEIYLSELKRRVFGDLLDLEANAGEKAPAPEKIIDSLGITSEDFQELEDWLANNKDAVAKANEHLLQKTSEENRRVQIPLGSTLLRDQAEKLITEKLSLLAKTTQTYLPNWPGLPETLNNYVITADSGANRAYMNRLGKFIVIPIQSVAYIFEKEIHLKSKELLKLFAEELLAHACHDRLTDSSRLPYFLKTQSGASYKTVTESSARYIILEFFQTIAKDMDFANSLHFDEPFEKIYQEFQESLLLHTYWINIYRYSIWTLAMLGETKMKEMPEIVKKYSVDPATPHRYLNRFANQWDKSTGHLLPKIVNELIYFPRPVEKIMAEIPPGKKDQVLKLILTGYWSPKGLNQWVKFNLSQS